LSPAGLAPNVKVGTADSLLVSGFAPNTSPDGLVTENKGALVSLVSTEAAGFVSVFAPKAPNGDTEGVELLGVPSRDGAETAAVDDPNKDLGCSEEVVLAVVENFNGSELVAGDPNRGFDVVDPILLVLAVLPKLNPPDSVFKLPKTFPPPVVPPDIALPDGLPKTLDPVPNRGLGAAAEDAAIVVPVPNNEPPPDVAAVVVPCPTAVPVAPVLAEAPKLENGEEVDAEVVEVNGDELLVVLVFAASPFPKSLAPSLFVLPNVKLVLLAPPPNNEPPGFPAGVVEFRDAPSCFGVLELAPNMVDEMKRIQRCINSTIGMSLSFTRQHSDLDVNGEIFIFEIVFRVKGQRMNFGHRVTCGDRRVESREVIVNRKRC
jgi:hypothetical protein